MGYDEHKKEAGKQAVACAIVTCSDTRTMENDSSGSMIKTLLENSGHAVKFYAVSKDEPGQIKALLNELAQRQDIQAIIFNGGTGVARRDNTFDAVSALLTKTLPGFGEIFRMLSHKSIGSGAILSRATAGVVRTQANGKELWTVVFSIPGSPNAVELAMHELILPEISHLVWETLR